MRHFLSRALLASGAMAAALTLAAAAPAAAQQRAPTASAPATPWWHDAVFYCVFVRSFADSSAGPLSRDGIGDIPGLIERLDYLNDGDPATTTDLGVTALWLLPIHPSPSYHGYDVTEYKAVNPQYGTAEDFRRLADECRKRGIRLVIDLVINHTSDRHPWFIESQQPGSAKRDWYTWSDTDPGWRGSWNQQVWHRPRPRGGAAAQPPRNQWYLGLFSDRMPDLNVASAGVTDAINDLSAFWLTEMRADGFRLDAIKHLCEDGRKTENVPATNAWLRKWRTSLAKVRPGVFTIGEIWSGTDIVRTYVGDQLEAGFDFDLASAILAAANSGRADGLARAAERSARLLGTGRAGTFLANHDMDRAMSQLKGDAAKARLAAAIQFTLPGIPFIYYGEEIGMVGQKPDERIRTPMQWTDRPGAGFTTGRPWQAVNADAAAVNVATQAQRDDSLLSHYRRLVALRHGTPALATGDFAPVTTGNPAVMAFLRRAPTIGADGKPGVQRVLVLANLGAGPVSDYSLAFGAGAAGLDGAVASARLLLAVPSQPAAGDVQPPVAEGLGAATGYKPLPRLSPRAVYIIELLR